MSVVTAPPAEPDLLLLHRFIETGDPKTFAEIVQRYARVVYSASVRVLGDEGRAQDVSQETFFRLMQSPRVVTHSLAGWLHRTATHLALDARRSEKSRKAREQIYGLEQHEIDEPLRGLLIRHFLQGVQQAELAAEMDVSPATLSRRIKSGLELLQQNLRKRGIYLSVALLAGFCTSSTHAAVPAGLVSEMGKMNLIVSLRQIPTGPMPPSGPHFAPYRMGVNPKIFIPAKYVAAFVIINTVLAVYMFATVSSWIHANASPPDQHTEPSRVTNDR
jgi:DNA-directed RNA polymerase specialized sigma24 family protein